MKRLTLEAFSTNLTEQFVLLFALGWTNTLRSGRLAFLMRRSHMIDQIAGHSEGNVTFGTPIRLG